MPRIFVPTANPPRWSTKRQVYEEGIIITIITVIIVLIIILVVVRVVDVRLVLLVRSDRQTSPMWDQKVPTWVSSSA